MKKQLTAILLAAGLASSLGGCVAMVAGGAAAGATISATDRRSTGAQADDQVMELRIRETALNYLNAQPKTANFEPKVTVVSYNRQILLLGLVTSQADKSFVEQVARSQPAAQKIYNYIDIANQTRGFGNVSSDTWITSKVRTNLINIKGVSSNHIKVITYNGVTYVMGVLTSSEQQAATQRISTTAGVQKVVTLYQTFEKAPDTQTGSNNTAS